MMTEERREINRVEYKSKAVIVASEDQEMIYAEVCNVSPLGMGLTAGAETPDILGKEVIAACDTIIMFADVARQEKKEDGSFSIGLKAKRFTPQVLRYLFNRIGK